MTGYRCTLQLQPMALNLSPRHHHRHQQELAAALVLVQVLGQVLGPVLGFQAKLYWLLHNRFQCTQRRLYRHRHHRHHHSQRQGQQQAATATQVPALARQTPRAHKSQWSWSHWRKLPLHALLLNFRC